MHSAKRPAIRRLWIIDRELRSRTRPTAHDLARLCEVDTKTIRRDLAMLSGTYGAPVVFNRKLNGWEYSCETWRLPAIIMTEGQLMAMFLAGQALQVAEGTPYAEQLKQAFQKLAEFLPDEITVQWQSLEQLQSFRNTVTTASQLDVYHILADAILKSQQLRMTYWTASRDEESERVVDPYHLTWVDGQLYLLAYCHLRQGVRMFAPARIREVVQSGQTFVRPADFQVSDELDGSFRLINDKSRPMQTVRLRFSPTVAGYLAEKIWHPSQSLSQGADGELIMEMSLRSLVEVRRWVLSWGRDCEVLAPEELREDLRREVTAMLSHLERQAMPSPVSAMGKIRLREQRRQRDSAKIG